MPKFASLLFAASALAATGAALAEPPLVNDASYVAGARCLGLSTSPELGPFDATAIVRFMEVQAAGRPAGVADRANEARDRARQDAITAGPDARHLLRRERVTGACLMYGRIGERGGY